MGREQPDSSQPVIVLLTSDDQEHHYVANRILRDFELRAIIVDHGRELTRSERIRQLTDRYTAQQLASRALLRFSSAIFRDAEHRRRQLSAVLGAEAESFSRPDLVRHVHGINTADARALVEEASPDLILVYGTGIVGPRVLGIARDRALNLHTGMSPEYRGADCEFWPIYRREYRFVGATVHECTARVDGGEIYERARASLRPDDGQFAVFARCVEIGAELYVSAIQRAVDGRLTGDVQDLSIGREYRSADKQLRHDLAVRKVFRSGEFARAVQDGTSWSGHET